MAGGTPRVAAVEVCNSRTCEISWQLVRGDQVSFVSVEQARKIGCQTGDCPMALNDRAMPSDIKLPAGFVLIHDASGSVMNKCDFYCVRWHGGRRFTAITNTTDRQIAQEYFKGATPRLGEIETPVGAWKRVCRVKFIRYRRPGFARPFEHPYEPTVWLYRCQNALKLALPYGCVVDARGFVYP